MKKYLNLFLLPFLLMGITYQAHATHFNGGEVTYKCLGFGQYEVTLELYQDCSSGITSFFPTATIYSKAYNCNFGSIVQSYTASLDTSYEVSPICAPLVGTTTCSGGTLPGVRVGVYKVNVSILDNCGDFTFYYSSCCRVNGNNIQNPTGTGIGLYAEQDNRSYLCNDNVDFQNSAIAFAQLNQPFVFDPRGTDADNDDIRYRFVSPLDNINATTNTPVTLNPGYTPQQPFPFPFTMDSLTGVIQTTPTVPGTYVVAYMVEEYRNGDLIAKNLKEISVTVSDFGFGLATNNAPVYNIVNNTTAGTFINNTFRVCAGSPINFDINVTDADVGDTVRVLSYGIDALPGNPTFTTVGQNPQTNTFDWIAPLSGGSYDLVFIVQDPKCPVVASHQYFRIRIEVAGALGISISDRFLCSSPTIDLSVGSGGVYLWNTGDTTGTITVDSAGVYSVTTTDACGPAYASVEIFDEPQINIAGNNRDTAINLGDSLQLATGIQTGPLGNRYFEETTPQPIPSGASTLYPLLVPSIYPTRIDTNSLVEVCLNLTSSGPANLLDIFLSTPDGSLLPLSSANGGTSGGYYRICFSVNATDLVSNYPNVIIPTDSSYVPEGDWADLYGRMALGTWNLVVRSRNQFFMPPGNLLSYSIQFGGEYTFNWSSSDPDGNISCTDCSNPIVYPDTITTYTVAMTNGNNCTTYDTITVYPRVQEPIDTLYFLIAEDSLLEFCVPVPNYMNANNTTTNIISFGASGAFLQNSTDPFCFSYLNFNTAEYTDELVVAYCDNSGYCDTNVVYVTVASCVWAGDTDTNQVVNHFDILPIGLGFGQTDHVRPNADLNFDCEPGLFWANQTPQSNINYKHSDTDGDGMIDYDDTLAIVQNWGQFYVRNSSGTVRPGGTVPLYTELWSAIPSQTIQVPIMLGDSMNPADSVYGLAFTVNYDSTKVKAGSVSVLFNTSWMGNIGQDMIAVSKDNPTVGQVDVGLTRTDQMTRSGFGQIGVIQMTIKDDIIQKSRLVRLNTHIDGARLIDNNEIEIGTTPVYTYVLISTPTSVDNIGEAAHLDIFPNPAQSLVQIQSSEEIEYIEVINAAGQTVLNQPLNGVLGTQMDVSKLTVGVYVLRVQTTNGLQNRRIVVQRP